jgi:hypothetical protein|tara:strand:- start:122 stop:256 length:135 start_codon:yes stop_codon:yes gene_type:complete
MYYDRKINVLLIQKLKRRGKSINLKYIEIVLILAPMELRGEGRN